ncbi:MAG: hypothetical protein ACI90A_001364, partial [Shewanella sp.]
SRSWANRVISLQVSNPHIMAHVAMNTTSERTWEHLDSRRGSSKESRYSIKGFWDISKHELVKISTIYRSDDSLTTNNTAPHAQLIDV